jgi:hypothetical protein
VPGADNPYTVSVDAGRGAASEEGIHKTANLAAIWAAVAVLVFTPAAPLAVFFGHRALSSIKRAGLGLQHRGAALVGVVLGWLMVPLFLLQVLNIANDVRSLLSR